MSDFVHLHLHTEYSLLDGACRLSQEIPNFDAMDDSDPPKKDPNKTVTVNPLASALKELGMKACAITDHGNMYGVFNFVVSLRSHGIKPIIGQEFYVAEDMYVKTPEVLKERYHLILLAKNKTGYENLMYLSSIAFVDGFYMRPRIDLQRLEGHTEGLICLSACLAGKVPRLILKGDYEGAKQYAARMRDMFAEGDYYIELQDHGKEEDKIVMNPLVRIAREIGVKVVATNDVHYIKKEDAELQDTMMCITMGCKKSDEKQNSARFTEDEYYLKSGEEMEKLFDWIPEAIESTTEIADKVEDYFVDHAKPIIPIYHNEEMGDRDEMEYLRDLAWQGVKRRYPVVTDEVRNRLEYELGVIHKCGFDGYFLIVWDYVHAAQEMGVPVGPGRGSGCGSIVAYCIGITDIDPLKYNLLFERFLSAERVSMPDFDVDFCFVRRQEVIDYCVKKYGKERVSQIIAYSTMSAKAVVKDVARVLDVPYSEANAWVREIPTGKVLLPQVLHEGTSCFSADFKRIYDEGGVAKEVIDIAMGLEGMPRQTSMHAAGVVICRDPVVQYCALSRNGPFVTTQFDKKMIEKIGLLKMDFLGLKTLTDIDEAIKLIKKDRGVEIDFHKLGYDDKKVFELISSGDCEAVFQLESGGMKRFMAQLQPTNIEDVIAGISLYRPGPMQFIGDFIKGKHNPESITYAHPLLEDILKTTYGCIVYQEQVMQIAQRLGGYTFGGADILRRAVAKKSKTELEAQKKIFLHGGVLKDDKTKTHIPGAVANGVDEEVASHLFDQILKFADYAFNKSHAAAYTLLTYQTAFLKLYYPIHFIVAVVNNRITNADEVKHYMGYLRRTGVAVLPPDINRSEKLFSIEGNNVRYGLMGIKNVGDLAMEFILEEREKNGKFKNIRDFFERCAGGQGDNPAVRINKRMIESLIKGGALDCFGKSRATLMASYERILDAVLSDKKSRVLGQLSLFDALLEQTEIVYTEVEEYPKMQRLAFEKEVLGMYISGHPLDDYHDDRHEFDFDTSMLMVEEKDEGEEFGDAHLAVDSSLDGKTVKFGCIISSYERKLTKKQQKFAIGRLEDMMGSISFTMYTRAYERYFELLDAELPVKVVGKIDLSDESEPKIVIERMEIWKNSDAEGAPVRERKLYVNITTVEQKNLVASLLSMYPGKTPCHAQILGQVRAFPQTVEVGDELIFRLKQLLGENNVKYE